MPRVGKFDLPVISVDEAVNRLRKIREVAGGRTVAREVAADAMGMSPKGGQTQYIFSSMAGYGLIDTGGNEIKVTDLGEAAIFGDSNESYSAKIDAVKRADLLREIYAKFGPIPSDEQVRAFLRQDAQVELAKIPGFLEKVTRLLKQMSQYAAPRSQQLATQTEGSMGSQSTRMGVMSKQPSDDNSMEVRIGSYSFSLPLDDLELASNLTKSNIDGIITSLKARRQNSAGDTAARTETG